MSAASFLGIAGLVALTGFDGLIYSIGWLVGWPIVLFLIAEPLRNLGRTRSPTSSRSGCGRRPVRIAAAIGTLAVVSFYLIAQMVGAGNLIRLLFGLATSRGRDRRRVMLAYVLFGGMIATTWVQIVKAVLLLGGATLLALLGAGASSDEPARAVRAAADRTAGCWRPASWCPIRSTRVAGHGADVRHGRAAAHPDALLHGARRRDGAHVGLLRDASSSGSSTC